MIEWAIEVWPYVNGKALMSGHRLREMEASEMLDVLHFLFEEDWVPSSPEVAEARSEIRTVVYESMYKRTYPYKLPKRDKNVKPGGKSTGRAMDNTYVDDFDDLANEKPFEPRMSPPKPYTPATQPDLDSVNPFPGLDGPLG